MDFVRALLASLLLLGSLSAAAVDSYSFGVLPQRSATLTAQYWNPILDYASRHAGVLLVLKTTRSGQESRDAAKNGEYDFIYSNHIFQPAVAAAGYRVILRPRELSIVGQLVTLDASSVQTLNDLNGQAVGFPSAAAFVGYALPMDHLLQRGIVVNPVFGGNQEGIMAQLKSGRVAAAGVNGQVMQEYATREGLRYRVLWESEPYFNLPVAAHPRIPGGIVRAVQNALDAMEDTPEGRKILADSAALVGQQPPFGFRLATSADYSNYIEYYKKTLIRELR